MGAGGFKYGIFSSEHNLGYAGGGKIFLCNVENVVKIWIGEEGDDALQDKG